MAAERIVTIRGIDVPESELPTLRAGLAALAAGVQSGATMQTTEGDPLERALSFMGQAAAAGHPTSPKDYGEVVSEIDAAIARLD